MSDAHQNTVLEEAAKRWIDSVRVADAVGDRPPVPEGQPRVPLDEMMYLLSEVQRLRERKHGIDISELTGVDEPADDVQTAMVEACLDVARMLLHKNAQYGNAALDPLRIFSKASPREQILVRLDDKISRIARGAEGMETEDVHADILGYLILLRVCDKLADV